MLQSVAVCFSVLIDINLDDLLQKGSEDTESAGALQCVAVCCSVLQRDTVCSLISISQECRCVAVRCSASQCVAVCCSVIQCVH